VNLPSESALPDLHVAAWSRGHHGGGEVGEVLTLPEDREVLLLGQASCDAKREGAGYVVDDARPHSTRSLPASVAYELQRRVEALALEWPEPKLALGKSSRGLWVAHRGIEVSFLWEAWSGDAGPRGLAELHAWVRALIPDA